MPIYEYQCEACGGITSALILKPGEEKDVRCRTCDHDRLTRVLSRCVVHKTEAQRVAEFDPRSSKGDAFYKDDRNVGLWAQKRMSRLGVDLGPQMDQIVDKARSGKILDDLDP